MLKVSIVILTYNSQRTLQQCLDAVTRLEYPSDRYDVILLDNGSRDDTVRIIEASGCDYRVLPEHNLSQLRNHGAEMAKGDIVAFVDSDCIVQADWLDQVVKWFDDPEVGIVGNEYILPDNATVFERNWYANYNSGVSEKELIPAGNMAIRKSYWQDLGGFDDRLSTGEDDYILNLFRRAGYRTVSDHKVRSVHLGNAKNLRQYFKKERWYGLGMFGTLHLSKFDKPLIATLIFMLSIGLFLLFLLLYASLKIDGVLSASLFNLAVAAMLPLASAAERIYKKGRKGNLFYVAAVFAVFFAARGSIILESIARRTFKTG